MLKLCKLMSCNQARDQREAKNYILVLEIDYFKKPGVHMNCNGRRRSAMDESQIPHRSVSI